MKFLNNLKTKFTKNKWYLLALIIFFIVAIIINDPFGKEKNVLTINDAEQGTGYTEKITHGVTISQKFVAQEDNLRKISISAVTYLKTVDSNINVTVKEVKSGKVIFENVCNTKALKDNDYFAIFIEDQKDSKGKEYEIIIEGIDGTIDNAIGFMITSNLENTEPFVFNGTKQESKLVFNTTYTYNAIGTLNSIIWTLAFIIAFIYVLNIGEKADEKEFLKFAIVLGICMILVTPFCHVLDEGTHFFRSYLISEGDFYDTKDEDGNIGGYAAQNLRKFLALHNITFEDLLSDSEPIVESFDNENKVFVDIPYLSSTIPIDHSVSAIGIFIGNLFNFNVLTVVILSRLMTLICYTVLTYFAIKNLKYYKSIAFVIATIPVGFWLAGTVSIDPVLNGACFLFTSICLKYHFDKDENTKITILDMVLLIVMECLIVSVKYLVYSPLMLLFFMIPKNKFKNTKQYVTLIVIAVLVGILLVGWQMWMLNTFEYEENRNGHTDIQEQLEFMGENKLYTLKAFVTTFMSSVIIFLSGFGMERAIWTISSTTGIIILLATALEKNKFEFKNSKLILSALAGGFFLIFLIGLLAEYLAFTPVGKHVIDGYQERYFIPMMMLLLIPVANSFKIKNDINNWEKKLVFAMTILNLNLILGFILFNFKI